jgi:hypothetical protein
MQSAEKRYVAASKYRSGAYPTASASRPAMKGPAISVPVSMAEKKEFAVNSDVRGTVAELV